jgi:hypothetical protein
LSAVTVEFGKYQLEVESFGWEMETLYATARKRDKRNSCQAKH